MTTPHHQFPTEIAGLAEAESPRLVEPAQGDRFNLTIAPVAKRAGDATARMLAFDGSIPGPTFRVGQDSEVLLDIANHDDSQ